MAVTPGRGDGRGVAPDVTEQNGFLQCLLFLAGFGMLHYISKKILDNVHFRNAIQIQVVYFAASYIHTLLAVVFDSVLVTGRFQGNRSVPVW